MKFWYKNGPKQILGEGVAEKNLIQKWPETNFREKVVDELLL